jgi:hypothetical protein
MQAADLERFRTPRSAHPKSLDVIQLRIISLYKNRRDLGHVPQLFRHPSCCPRGGRHSPLISVPHHTVGAHPLWSSRATVFDFGSKREILEFRDPRGEAGRQKQRRHHQRLVYKRTHTESHYSEGPNAWNLGASAIYEIRKISLCSFLHAF